MIIFIEGALKEVLSVHSKTFHMLEFIIFPNSTHFCFSILDRNQEKFRG